MNERPSRTDLIKIFMSERDYHFSHPHEVNTKLWYTIGGMVSTVFITVGVKGADGNLMYGVFGGEGVEAEYPYWPWISIGTIIMGYIVLFWGLAEHKYIHIQQGRRLEEATEYLLTADPSDFDFDSFWEKYGTKKLYYTAKLRSENATSLIVREPDSRKWLHFHDRKIQLGVALAFKGFVGLIILLMLVN